MISHVLEQRLSIFPVTVNAQTLFHVTTHASELCSLMTTQFSIKLMIQNSFQIYLKVSASLCVSFFSGGVCVCLLGFAIINKAAVNTFTHLYAFVFNSFHRITSQEQNST